jgi:CheY-like chemotaxis protein
MPDPRALISTCTSGSGQRSGGQRTRAIAPDLALRDLNLPDMHGSDVLRYAAARPDRVRNSDAERRARG